MKLIVGLGNPDRKFKNTRHNIGFEVIENIAKKSKIRLSSRRFRSVYGIGKLHDAEVALLLPQTFVNLSGLAVESFTKNKKVAVHDILVVCDDVNLPFGALRIRTKGSSGGHNGLESIIGSVGTQNFARLRIGIGKFGENMATYVLGKFTKEENKQLKGIIDSAAEAAWIWAKQGSEAAMRKFNVKGEMEA